MQQPKNSHDKKTSLNLKNKHDSQLLKHSMTYF